MHDCRSLTDIQNLTLRVQILETQSEARDNVVKEIKDNVRWLMRGVVVVFGTAIVTLFGVLVTLITLLSGVNT